MVSFSDQEEIAIVTGTQAQCEAARDLVASLLTTHTVVMPA